MSPAEMIALGVYLAGFVLGAVGVGYLDSYFNPERDALVLLCALVFWPGLLALSPLFLAMWVMSLGIGALATFGRWLRSRGRR